MFMAPGLRRYSAGRTAAGGGRLESRARTCQGGPGGGQLITWLKDRAFRVAALLTLSLCIAACSTLKLGYENLPRLVKWQADRYLALDAGQEELVARHARALQGWHRQNLLPVYAEFLGRMEEELRSPVTPVQVAAWRRTVVQSWEPLAAQLAPAVAELAVTLRPEQLDHLRGALARANEKAAAEYHPADPVRRRQLRYRRWVERTESLLGEASEGQKAVVREAVAASQSGAAGKEEGEARWQARLARQKAVVDLLGALSAEKPAPAQAEQRARAVLAGLFAGKADGGDGGDEGDEGGSMAGAAPPGAAPPGAASVAEPDDVLVARVLALATPEQRRRLIDSLDGYRRDFRLLASR